MKIDDIGTRKETLHLPPDGHPASATGRRSSIGHPKDTLHRLPDGYTSSSPERRLFKCPRPDLLPRSRPEILHRPQKFTLHLPPNGHPSSALARRPCICSRKVTLLSWKYLDECRAHDSGNSTQHEEDDISDACGTSEGFHLRGTCHPRHGRRTLKKGSF